MRNCFHELLQNIKQIYYLLFEKLDKHDIIIIKSIGVKVQ